jgi:hypothetical protein
MAQSKGSGFRVIGEVTRKLQLTALGILLSLGLSACGYQGWTRYECQEFENWQAPECNPPQCKALGVCTEDIFGEDPNGFTSSKTANK